MSAYLRAPGVFRKEYAFEKWADFDKDLFDEIYNDNLDSGVLLFNVNNYFSQDVAIYLDKFKICIRAGNHCGKLQRCG